MKTQFKKIMIFPILFSSVLLASCMHGPTMSLASVSAPNTSNKTALRIYDRLPIYAVAAKMPWKPIKMNTPLKVGGRNNHVPIIRERLIALHNMQGPDNQSTLFDSQLSHAVSEFQYLNGLKQTGTIDQATLDALNITPAARYNELVQSMHEWAKYPEDQNSRYVQVNIPSYEMHLISGGSDALSMRAIVGRPSRPTPTLTSNITTIVFNPTWTVPETILAKDVIPGMQKNPNYMKEHYDMRVYASHDKNAAEINPSRIDWQTATVSNFKYRVTAPPSDRNPLGRVKFIFANDQDVYMHDTPEKSLFALNDRARSSGCIRLEHPMELVRYFYADNSDLNESLVNQYLSTQQTKFIQLRNPMPVYITNIPAWADRYGRVHFASVAFNQSAREEDKPFSAAVF